VPSSSDLPEAQAPKTGGFASHPIEDVDYAIQVVHEMDLLYHSPGVPLRLEPEHGPAPKSGLRSRVLPQRHKDTK
jgi:hypothetical protein